MKLTYCQLQYAKVEASSAWIYQPKLSTYPSVHSSIHSSFLQSLFLTPPTPAPPKTKEKIAKAWGLFRTSLVSLCCQRTDQLLDSYGLEILWILCDPATNEFITHSITLREDFSVHIRRQDSLWLGEKAYTALTEDKLQVQQEHLSLLFRTKWLHTRR